MISDCQNCKNFFKCNLIDVQDEDSFPEDCYDFEFQEEEQ